MLVRQCRKKKESKIGKASRRRRTGRLTGSFVGDEVQGTVKSQRRCRTCGNKGHGPVGEKNSTAYGRLSVSFDQPP